VLGQLVSKSTGKKSEDLENSEREQRTNLIVNLVAGIGAALDARATPTAITAARTELENNTLSVQEHQARIQEMMLCKGAKTCEQRVTEKYDALSKQRRQAVAQCTGSQDCFSKHQEQRELAAAYAQRVEELQSKVGPWTPAERQEWISLSTNLLPVIDGSAALRKAIDSGPSDNVKEALWQELGGAGIAGAAGISSAMGGVRPGRKNVANEVESSAKGAGGAADNLAASKVKWVDENAGMSSRARDYNDSATGARSNPATQSGQAPALERAMPDGSTRLVKFDGLDGNVLVDRKISVVTTSKSKDQALRQSEVLKQHGLTARWEVPNEVQAARAQKMFDELGIKNISVRVIREPGNQ
jgi:filamentous hemagglutinin